MMARFTRARVSIVTCLVISAFFQTANGETLSFAEVWRRIEGDSPVQAAALAESQAADVARDRGALHWLPRLYLDARTYRTDDPGPAFFGLLEQRELQASDFSPQAINHPRSDVFTRGTLGVDFAIYEGGAKSAQKEMLVLAAAARSGMASQVRVDQYAQASAAYGILLVARKQIENLSELKGAVARLVDSYQLGSKSNPVGYSGLLGMKSLANRIAGLIAQSEAQLKSQIALFKEMGAAGGDWTPEPLDPVSFIARYLESAEVGPSFRAIANQENARAAVEAARMEKGRFLPRAGAFAETFMFNGKRDTASGYTAGLYLQWDLFNPADYGLVREARLKALAASKHSEANERDERAARSALFESVKALKANLVLIDESDRLLREQMKTTGTLFRNGSISALQIVEVLNRRADLIVQQADTGMALVKAAASAAATRKIEIPNVNGAENGR